MKRIFSALLALAVLTALVIVATTWKHSVRAVYAQGGCSVASLSGSYGFAFSGFELEPTPPSEIPVQGRPVPFYGAGQGTFDGAGKFSATFAFSQNGALPGDKYIVQTNVPYSATYTVNPDCTGVITGAPGSDSLVFVIVSGGAEILGTDIAPTSTLNIDLKKQ